jgi:hypothetical protein
MPSYKIKTVIEKDGNILPNYSRTVYETEQDFTMAEGLLNKFGVEMFGMDRMKKIALDAIMQFLPNINMILYEMWEADTLKEVFGDMVDYLDTDWIELMSELLSELSPADLGTLITSIIGDNVEFATQFFDEWMDNFSVEQLQGIVTPLISSEDMDSLAILVTGTDSDFSTIPNYQTMINNDIYSSRAVFGNIISGLLTAAATEIFGVIHALDPDFIVDVLKPALAPLYYDIQYIE